MPLCRCQNQIRIGGLPHSLNSLEKIDLSYNKVSNITPLVENIGFGEDASLDISGNALDCSDNLTKNSLSALVNRGVKVTSDCEIEPQR